MQHTVVEHCSISLYADDTSIYVSHPDPATAGNLLEEDLRYINEWLVRNGLKMNVSRTQLMVLCSHRRSHLEDQVKVHVGASELCKQNSVNYLGVTVDKHLRWHPHVDKVRRMSRQNCGHRKSECLSSSIHLPSTLPVFCPPQSRVLLCGLGQVWGSPHLQTETCTELCSLGNP